MSRKAVVFDLDGTLVDSLPDLTAALNKMLEGAGRRLLTEGEVRLMIGDGTRALVRRALLATSSSDQPGANAPALIEASDFENVHRQFQRAYEADLTNRSRLYRGVKETLAALNHRGFRLGICTNKQQRATLAVLQGFGILSYFTAVVGGDATKYRKPDPRHLLAVLDQLNVTPNESVMVGDNENDYAAAQEAGTAAILMRYGYLRVAPETLSPDAWLDEFGEIPQTIAVL